MWWILNESISAITRLCHLKKENEAYIGFLDALLWAQHVAGSAYRSCSGVLKLEKINGRRPAHLLPPIRDPRFFGRVGKISMPFQRETIAGSENTNTS
ncbi:MAG: hypothetical protein FWH51_03470 [Dehalococcoidia bacterium]|nr:hypothetical protein [Dehalococcoidia bacterium]MCL2149975.1 hypothetical protein [Dehalococcoidia bacterium]